MKTQFALPLRASALLVVGSLWSGCAQDSKPGAQPSSTPPAAVTETATSTNDVTKAQAETKAPDAKGVLRKIGPVLPPTSPAVAELVKLAEAGVGDAVIVSYIDNSKDCYNLSVDEILYLSDIGLSDEVISAMMRHDAQIRERATDSEIAKLESEMAGQQTNVQEQLTEIREALARRDAEAAAAQAAAAQTTNTPIIIPSQTDAAAQEAVEAPTYANEPTSYVNVPQQVSYFYNDLAPYGTWYDLPGYGWCWQPSVVVVNPLWQPYCHRGRWLWSDCGWYWHSDYSWGWAPFHYGRWHHQGHYGWMWYPDTCWGPSWVSWRYSGSHCGWAPLPPGVSVGIGVGLSQYGSQVGVSFGFGLGASHYTFVSWSHFNDHHPYRHYAPPERAHEIYKNSTVINNYVAGNNNTIINEGVGLKRVMAATQQEIKKVEVRDLPPNAGHYVKPDRPERSGNSMVVYRPKPASTGGPSGTTPVATHGPEGARRAKVDETAMVSRPPGRPNYSPSSPKSPTAASSLAPNPAPLRKSTEERAGFANLSPSLTPLRRAEEPRSGSNSSMTPQSSQPAPSVPQKPIIIGPNRSQPLSRGSSSVARSSSLERTGAATSSRSVPRNSGATGQPNAPSYANPSRSESQNPSVTKPYEPRSRPSVMAPQSSRSPTQPSTSLPNAPQYRVPQGTRPLSPPALSPTRPSTTISPPTYRIEPPRTAAPVPAPSYRAPATPSAPSYQPPARSYNPAPAPSYSAPRSAPSPPPSFSAPRAEPPRVAPSSPPAASSAPRYQPSTPSPQSGYRVR